MPQKPISRAEAQRTVDTIHKYLLGGYTKSEAITATAKELNRSRGTIFNRVEPNGALAVHKLKIDWSKYRSITPEEKVDALQKEIFQLRKNNKTLSEQIKNFHHATLDAQAIKEIILGIKETPVDVPKWVVNPVGNDAQQHIPMTIWSDWHAGEVVSFEETNGQNEFDTKIFEARVQRLVEKTIYLSTDYGPGNYPGIVVNLLGDFISGALHPELAKSDDEEVLPSVLRVVGVLIWALDRMLENFGKVLCPCAAGNHGRNTHKPEYKKTVEKNFDWLIYNLLALHYKKNKNITFLIPPSNDVHYNVFGMRFLAMHGDMIGVKGGDGIIGSIGPIMRGETKVGKQAAALGRDYDVLLMGHWHQPLWLQRVIVAGTLKGWDEFAQKALRAPPFPPTQPLWYVNAKHGITSRMEIYLEDAKLESDRDWVSWDSRDEFRAKS